MRRSLLTMTVMGAVFAAALGGVAMAAPIDVVASNFTFTPVKVEAHVGQPTTLHLTSGGGVHGIASSELGIASTTIAPGSPVDVTFTPKKAGTYAVHCSIVCGAGHEAMVLTVNVVP